MSDHVLCAVILPIAIVAVVACSPPSFVLLRLVIIALFATIAIAVALAIIIIAFFDAHQCAPSPPTAIRICSDGGVGSSRRRQQLGGNKGGRAAAATQRQC